MSRPHLSQARKRLFDAILATLTLLAIEGISCVMDLSMASRFGLMYREQDDLAGYREYLRYRDPVLGWPSSRQTEDRDATGSRIDPAYPDPATSPTRVSLYGDSYTFGVDVDNEHAWSNVLSKLIRGRVANYAVPGYGTDQAYLRFAGNERDAAPVVILGIFSENVMRNVNQYRNLFYPARFGFKPRFVLDEAGALSLVPLPSIPPEEYLAFVRDPDRRLPDEQFRLDGPWGMARFRFPYTLSLVRALGHFRVRAWVTGKPHWAAFYEDDHPSSALAITERIAVAFCDLAKARRKRPMVVMIPHPMDVAVFRKTGAWTYENLAARLAADGVDCVNLGTAIEGSLHGRKPQAIARGQHYDEEGYRTIGNAVFEALKARGILDPPGSVGTESGK
ncbi:MAG: hypothetical protein U0166_17730 [Acidobacteriota bacterium]